MKLCDYHCGSRAVVGLQECYFHALDVHSPVEWDLADVSRLHTKLLLHQSGSDWGAVDGAAPEATV
eukprot:scaffold365566_cov47-Prasinocladus_malaysianus.AAC.1